MYAFFPAAVAALHPPLQCISPPSCCYLLLFAAYSGGRGDVTPPCAQAPVDVSLTLM